VRHTPGALGAVALVALPFWLTNAYHLHVAIMAGIFTILALSLNLLLGYTGQLSLGHAAFFGIGAYTSALLALRLEWPFWVGLPAAALAAGLAGWAIGRLALKVRGAYFVLVTISFAGVISLVSVNWMELTNGPLGLPGVPAPSLAGVSFRTKSAYYYLVLVAAASAYLLCRRLVRSRLGRAFLALRENEPLAESVGIDPTRTLVLAAVVSAAMAGVAGSLYAHYTRFVSPEVFLFSYTVTMVIMVVAGGKGTLAGPVVGAVLFTVLPEALREAVAWQWQMLAYGIVLVLLVFFLPRGIVGAGISVGGGLDGPLRGFPQEGLRRQSQRSDGGSVPALRVENLAVDFGGVVALADVSFVVRPGTITSLIGPNGAGKTTAFNAITGYLRPRRGRVKFGDEPLIGRRACDIARRGIVRTFQKTSVFPALSVVDNVMIGLHLDGSAEFPAIAAARRRVRAEESRLQAEAAAIIAFVGLEHRRAVAASSLPYGEQRLVELAVALAARPRLLLLDEPGAGMTGAEKERLVELIRRIREQGVTVLLVEHDMRLVMGISDTVIVLNHGRVIAEGPPDTIQAHPDVIRAYLGVSRA
jgi:ABC-type branched-subunit amino acid transport system ATPase component/ABC-type branched-subunit amino acid transport system permease subunit